MSELVTIDITDGVADVRLNRADKYNALSPHMFTAITEAGQSLAQDTSLRAVVLSGNGRGFCAGLDFSSFQGMESRGTADAATGANDAAFSPGETLPENHGQRPAFVWKRMPVPVIAAIHGVAYGGGLQVALGADIRLVAPDAKLSVMEIKWGLVPDMGFTGTLRNIVRVDVLKELTFTGRVFGGAEAVELGLMTRVSESPLEDALAMAREIAGKSPHAIRYGKRLIEESWQGDVASGLHLEASLQRELIGGPNQVEAIKANFEKRAPAFVDPAA